MYNAFVKIKKKKALALHGANDTTQNCKAENQIDAGIKIKNINKRNETKHTKSNIQRKLNGKDM